MNRQTVFEVWPDSEYHGLHNDIRKEIDSAISDAVDAIVGKFAVGVWRSNVNGKWLVEVDKSEILEAVKKYRT